jgi:hypothetical protein
MHIFVLYFMPCSTGMQCISEMEWDYHGYVRHTGYLATRHVRGMDLFDMTLKQRYLCHIMDGTQ